MAEPTVPKIAIPVNIDEVPALRVTVDEEQFAPPSFPWAAVATGAAISAAFFWWLTRPTQPGAPR